MISTCNIDLSSDFKYANLLRLSLLFVGAFPAVFNHILSHVILISQSIF